MNAQATIVSRFVVFALRRIGLTADDRAAIPLLLEDLDLSGHIRRDGGLVPARISLRDVRTDPPATSLSISVDDPAIAAEAQRILDEYRPEADPQRHLEDRRSADEVERERLMREAGWTGQPAMPSAAVDVVMRGFDAPTEDPVDRDIWLRRLWDVRLAKADRARLVPWLLDRFEVDDLEDDRFLIAELVGRFALPAHADRLMRLASESRYGVMRRGIIRGAQRTAGERVGPLLVSLCEDETVRAVAIEALGRLGSPEHADALRRFLADRDATVRRATRTALKRMGADVPPPTRPVHRVPNRTTFDAAYQEWSTNLDLEALPGFLAVIAGWASDGFGEPEILEILEVVERMAVGGTRTFGFPTTPPGGGRAIGLRIHLDDEDSPDVYVFGPDDLRDPLQRWWEATG